MKRISILTLSFMMMFNSFVKADEIEDAKKYLDLKIADVKNSCSGIKSNLDNIFGLSIATTVSSGLGTLASGGALAVGIVKANTDKNIDTISKRIENMNYNEMVEELTQLKQEIESENNKSKTLGNVRTGLLAGATATSAVSTGTSIGATLTAGELAEKMAKCNKDLKALKIANSQLELLDAKNEKAIQILSVCSGFDEDNINQLKTLSTANAIVSGVGVGVAGAGTITSALANSKKTRNDDSEDGRKKEKNLNLASNILAGVSTGTSAASTALSATAISKAKKDSDMAEKCESVL